MLIYLLKANVALVLFYLAYYFGLRRLTFYTLNRFFLLGGIVCAAICPLIDPSLFIRQHQPLNAVAETYIPDLAALQTRQSVPFINVFLEYIFWAGVAVMSIRLVIQLLSLWKLHRHTTTTLSPEAQRLRITEKRVNPFSFMRNIYINPSLHSPDEFTSIIRHEQVHVRQWHTLDVLLGELNKIFYWFNPGAWLMSIAIRENLEFITDRSILRQGMDAKAYQYSLIKVSGIPYATAIANNFNFSHLKQRIMMMNKKRSSRYHLLRYVVLGAIMGVAVLSLNFTKAIARTEKVAKNIAAITFSKDTTKPTVAPVAPVPPPPPPPPPAPVKGKKMPPPPPPVPAVPAGTAVPAAPPVPAVPAVPGVPAAPDEHIVEPAKQGITLRSQMTAPPLYFVDGVNMGHQAPADLRPEEIESISVFKGEHAVQYGEDGKNGVIFIYTKGYNGDTKVKTVNTSFDYKTTGAAPTVATTTSTHSGQQSVVKVNTNTNTHANTITKVNANVNTTATNTNAPTKAVVDTKVNTATKVNADMKVDVDTADSKSENK
ncbi:M56 family metallopeptidase [Chitinophaga filiformis]|uniref:TonB-dependent Receptor Plug Domain n=1 Tax=Chitinophaga filiformis TaxID=104663 RepID=A0A1G8DZJ7_CHIFI|nr:M56 family metallopeptidase [Chitinophaga filiformis]SDH63142.1 TonB-dependent Receptor Plug Domain [Chitinophaga filiformis]